MIIGVIPARYASTRFPGKPLALIGGKPMIAHTYERALMSRFIERVIVATDDKRIYDECRNRGIDVLMTPDSLPTGSDRIAFVAQSTFNAEIIVNIQGDEPFIEGKMIDQAIQPILLDEEVWVSTLAKRIYAVSELSSPDVVKVVFDMNNNALYFSRSVIPFLRGHELSDDILSRTAYYKHVGLYVYRKEALIEFTALPQTDLENTEKLEQLRMLEHGFKLKIVETEFDSISVDTPADLERAKKHYAGLRKK